MQETTEEDVINGENILQEVSKKLHIPITYTVIEQHKQFTHQFVGERINLNRYVARKWSLGGK